MGKNDLKLEEVGEMISTMMGLQDAIIKRLCPCQKTACRQLFRDAVQVQILMRNIDSTLESMIGEVDPINPPTNPDHHLANTSSHC